MKLTRREVRALIDAKDPLSFTPAESLAVVKALKTGDRYPRPGYKWLGFVSGNYGGGPLRGLRECTVESIKGRLRAGDTIVDLARDFRTSERAIRDIRSGRTWKWVE